MRREINPTLAAFGAALRAVRKEIGLSQEQLANRAGLDRAYNEYDGDRYETYRCTDCSDRTQTVARKRVREFAPEGAGCIGNTDGLGFGLPSKDHISSVIVRLITWCWQSGTGGTAISTLLHSSKQLCLNLLLPLRIRQ